MDTWKVYCYTGENNKKYVGITARTLYDRAGKNGINYIKDNYKFGNAIQKYGFNFFTVEILENNLSFNQACEKEKYYINLYDSFNNGYNSTLGGDGHKISNYDWIIQLWNEGKSIQDIHEITGYGERAIQNALNLISTGTERIKRQAGKYLQKPVYQYTVDGQFVAEYTSIAEAARILNINSQNITGVIHGRRPLAGGYQWSNIKVEQLTPVQKKQGNHKELYQYDLEKQLITVFPSVAEASRQLNYQKEYLSKQARIQGKAYGYIWSYTPFS